MTWARVACPACDGSGTVTEWTSPYTTERFRCGECRGSGGNWEPVDAQAKRDASAWRRDPAPVALDTDDWVALGGLLS